MNADLKSMLNISTKIQELNETYLPTVIFLSTMKIILTCLIFAETVWHGFLAAMSAESLSEEISAVEKQNTLKDSCFR